MSEEAKPEEAKILPVSTERMVFEAFNSSEPSRSSCKLTSKAISDLMNSMRIPKVIESNVIISDGSIANEWTAMLLYFSDRFAETAGISRNEQQQFRDMISRAGNNLMTKLQREPVVVSIYNACRGGGA